MSMIGKTLAHYEITNQLGKGGTGARQVQSQETQAMES
jgi:hypothetical protein